MAFSYDPTTPRGKVRMTLGDRREETAVFDDAEVDAALAETGSWQGAVVFLARVRLGQLAREPASWTEDGRSVSRVGQMDALRTLIEQFGGSIPAPSTLPTAVIGFGGYSPSDLYRPPGD